MKADPSIIEGNSGNTWEKHPTSLHSKAEVHGGWQWIHFCMLISPDVVNFL